MQCSPLEKYWRLTINRHRIQAICKKVKDIKWSIITGNGWRLVYLRIMPIFMDYTMEVLGQFSSIKLKNGIGAKN